MKFAGRYYHTLDPKGRTSIPVSFREILSQNNFDRIVLTNDQKAEEQVLVGYTPDRWDELVQKLERQPQFDENVEMFKLYYISGAQEVSIDRQGRILVPPSLREATGLDKEIVIIGAGDTIQIWSKEAWQEVSQKARKSFKQIKAALADVL
ncbi:MAG: division/cell wall cluster transcriptional repressor MraZ [Candidatus Alcyoniella australis]|nr:division/cell wall cluster transcriptional repressor MraZ [Candidatus Alcyoniella australis]